MKEKLQVKAIESNRNERGKAKGQAGTKQKVQLPWWVELLFVQVGLPENLLRRTLKIKKQLKTTASNNKSKIGVILIFLISLGYLSPLTKEARLNNECIKVSETTLLDKIIPTEKFNKKELKAIASRYCKGGYIGYIDINDNR